MAKLKFSHNFRAKKEGKFIRANEEVEMTEKRANEVIKNIKQNSNVDVTYEIIEADQTNNQKENKEDKEDKDPKKEKK